MTPLHATLAALAFRDWLHSDAGGPGAPTVKRRNELIARDWSDASETELADAEMALGSIAAVQDMPPETDLVSLAVDIIAFKIEATARSDAWRAVRINPNGGRDLLARNAHAVTWPVWNALRSGVLDLWPRN